MSGVNRCQEMGHGVRSAWWRVRSGAERLRVFLGIVYMVNPSFTYHKCGVMLILKCSPCTTVAVQ